MRFLNRIDDLPPMRIRRRRQQQRRVFLGTVSALVLAVSASGAWYIGRDGRLAAYTQEAQTRIAKTGADLHLTVESVQVEGRQRADKRAIRAALGVSRGTPILSVDLDAAKARLESVPWVHNASVERLLPDTLYVRLTERTPLALWQHQGKFDLVDQDGNIIADADIRDYPFLPQVVGSGAPAAAPDLLKVLGGEPALQGHVTASVRVGGRRWDIHLDNNIVVSLPENNAASAWHRLAALDRSNRLLERDVQIIDLRLSDRVVLRVPPDIAKSIIKKGKAAQASPNT
jgi:cell division protein FtsQ